jgi:hypothetical protein
MIPFNPDYVIAPEATLREWMNAHAVTAHLLARLCTGPDGNDITARLRLEDVLSRKPLGPGHAEALERGTGIPAAFWLEAERLYRDGLAAGKPDWTGTPEGDTR